jgi:hypothetical protein
VLERKPIVGKNGLAPRRSLILDDVARFRALSPAERIRTIREMLADGEFLLGKAPDPAWARQYSEEQELLAQRNIRDFIAHHAR